MVENLWILKETEQAFGYHSGWHWRMGEARLLKRLGTLVGLSLLQAWLLQFSCSVMSNSLWPHGLQHTRLPCPSPAPRDCLNSCPSSNQWGHPTISSSVSPPPPTFNLSQHQGLFQWVSSSHQVAKVLELHYQSFQWILGLISFRMDWFDLHAVQGTLESLLQTTDQKHQFFGTGISICSSSHHYTWLLENP